MSIPAGWYDDGSGRQRWWDGNQWTEHFAPEQATAAPETPVADPAAQQAYAAAYATPEQPTIPYAAGDYPGAYDASAYPVQTGAVGGPEKKKVAVLGWIALGVAVLGLLMCWIPFVGLFLPFVGLVLSIIALFMKGAKWPGIVGLVASVIGLIVSVVMVVLFFTLVQQADVPESFPSSSTSDEGTDGGGSSSEGRPTAEEVAEGIQETTEQGDMGTFTDAQLQCFGEEFVASDIPDDVLWVIADGDALTDVDAASALAEGLTDSLAICATR